MPTSQAAIIQRLVQAGYSPFEAQIVASQMRGLSPQPPNQIGIKSSLTPTSPASPFAPTTGVNPLTAAIEASITGLFNAAFNPLSSIFSPLPTSGGTWLLEPMRIIKLLVGLVCILMGVYLMLAEPVTNAAKPIVKMAIREAAIA